MEHIPESDRSGSSPMALRTIHRVNNASTAQIYPVIDLISSHASDIELYFQRVKNKEFLLNIGQGLPAYALEKAWKTEEAVFLKKCKNIALFNVPKKPTS